MSWILSDYIIIIIIIIIIITTTIIINMPPCMLCMQSWHLALTDLWDLSL